MASRAFAACKSMRNSSPKFPHVFTKFVGLTWNDLFWCKNWVSQVHKSKKRLHDYIIVTFMVNYCYNGPWIWSFVTSCTTEQFLWQWNGPHLQGCILSSHSRSVIWTLQINKLSTMSSCQHFTVKALKLRFSVLWNAFNFSLIQEVLIWIYNIIQWL